MNLLKEIKHKQRKGFPVFTVLGIPKNKKSKRDNKRYI